jgi:hypothetical protein
MKMKTALWITILLNLTLLGCLVLVLTNQHQKETVRPPIISEVRPLEQTVTVSVVPPPSDLEPASFRWSQLTSAKDYRLYIANLRAIGCPEVTIGDIVRGDTGRVFARERSELALDESGTGPWSPQAEKQLVADLLEQPESDAESSSAENPKYTNDGDRAAGAPVLSQSAQSAAVHYPLFLQNVNWSASGFTADQQAAIAQSRQQFQTEINGPNSPLGGTANPNGSTAGPAGSSSNPEPNDATTPAHGQTALQNADDQLRALLGAQGYAAYQQQQYNAWYQPQVMANADGVNLTINPGALPSR